ncbi:hypothetical protein ACJJI3_21455 [Microbulbifer sp. ZKSA004]|uniref:hypothetical protein n=1 Tax=Microbulbifer sp. ZKSA004 TaxID=3243389 RepID=UPI004039450D
MFNKVLAILCFLAPASVWAHSSTGSISITKLQSWNGGGIFIKTDELEISNPAGCAITDQYVLSPNASEMSQSMLLSSYIAEQKLNLIVYGDGCENDRPMIVAVTFHK